MRSVPPCSALCMCDATHRLRHVRQREEDGQRVRRQTRHSLRRLTEEVRTVRMPCLRRGACRGGVFGEVVRPALLAERDHLAVRHNRELVTEHRREQLREERRRPEQQLGQVIAAVPAIEASTVALYNLCALHRHSRQPVQVRGQPAALGLVTAADRSEQCCEAASRLVGDAAEGCWCEGRVEPAHAVLREERGARARVGGASCIADSGAANTARKGAAQRTIFSLPK